MGKEYRSVLEIVNHLTDDEEFKARFRATIAAKGLAHTLFALRCSSGVTQKQMAKRLGCTQSRISKLENADMDRISVGDLVKYAAALGLRLSIAFHREMTALDRVREGPILEISTPAGTQEEALVVSR